MCCQKSAHKILINTCILLSGTRVARTDGFSRSYDFNMYIEEKKINASLQGTICSSIFKSRS